MKLVNNAFIRWIGIVFCCLLACGQVSALDKTLTLTAACTKGDLDPIEGRTVQGWLDYIASNGGGILTLGSDGTGYLCVRGNVQGPPLQDRVLKVNSSTVLQGDASRPQESFGGYGMKIVGLNDDGGNWRTDPVVRVEAGATNVTIYNLYFDGDGDTSNPLSSSAISIDPGASSVIISYNMINNSRKFGVTATQASYVEIKYLTLNLSRTTPGGQGEPEGGAGIWCSSCSFFNVHDNVIRATEYYNSGPPDNDSRANQTPPYPADPITDSRAECLASPRTACAAKAMDLVAFYDGHDNRITNNDLAYGNTAGIYLAKCRRPDPGYRASWCTGFGESADTIENNTLTKFREHGIDLADCSPTTVTKQSPPLPFANLNYFGPVVVRFNSVTYVESSNLSLGGCPQAIVKYNTFSNGGQWKTGAYDAGSLSLAGATNNTAVEGNTISASANGYGNEYAIAFVEGGGPTNNAIGGLVTTTTQRAHPLRISFGTELTFTFALLVVTAEAALPRGRRWTGRQTTTR